MNDYKKIIICFVCSFISTFSYQSDQLTKLIDEKNNTFSDYMKALKEYSALEKRFHQSIQNANNSEAAQDESLNLERELRVAKEKKYETHVKHLQAGNVLQQKQIADRDIEINSLRAKHDENSKKIAQLLTEQVKLASNCSTTSAVKATLEEDVYNLEHEKDRLEEKVAALKEDLKHLTSKVQFFATEDLYSDRKPRAQTSSNPVPALNLKGVRE